MKEKIINHRKILTILLIDLFLYILLVKSNIVLPYINPSIEEYSKVTSFPRNTNQVIMWYALQIPISMGICIYLIKTLFTLKGAENDKTNEN